MERWPDGVQVAVGAGRSISSAKTVPSTRAFPMPGMAAQAFGRTLMSSFDARALVGTGVVEQRQRRQRRRAGDRVGGE